MKSKALMFLALWVGATPSAWAASINTTPLTSTQKNIETLGTGAAIAQPLAAAGVTLYKDDRAV